MSKITVVLDRKGLSVSMDANAMRVDRPDGPPQRFPIDYIDKVVVIGRPEVTCDVWRALAAKNIPGLLLPGRGRGAAAHVGPWPSSSAPIRLAQFKTISEKDTAIPLCRLLISKKLDGQLDVIRKRLNVNTEVTAMLGQMEEARKRISGSQDRNNLLGLEGAAASAYFKAIGKTISSKWGFFGRNRRPPKDPLNALFSLGYTLGTSEIRREILIAGLDPAIGFLHANQTCREGLTLDLLEPLRPVIDDFALGLISKILTPNHFVTNRQDGCLLTKDGRKRFFKEWFSFASSDDINTNLKMMAKEIVILFRDWIDENPSFQPEATALCPLVPSVKK